MEGKVNMKAQIKYSDLEKLDKITEEFISTNEESENALSPIELCKLGIRKIRLAKEFSGIDEQILNYSSETNIQNGFNAEAFSAILSLESRRLTFKEEANKCRNQETFIKTKTQIKLSN
jgi:hypothetical protein